MSFAVGTGDYDARVGAVGATLLSARFRGRDLIVPVASRRQASAMEGAVLAPWPNRLADGRFEFGGAVHQLAVDEPATGTAVHGLVHELEFALVGATASGVALSARIEARSGYPWTVRIDVEVSALDDGVRQTITATNVGAGVAPIGLGAHPYFLAGAATRAASAGDATSPASPVVDGWRLTLPADELLLVSDDRLLPLARARVGDHDAGRFDFRHEHEIGPTEFNHAFTALHRDTDGFATARLTGTNGHGVEVSWDAPWVQLYSADLPPPGTRRHALAIEPMTCPPDAFNSGTDLRVLAPGESTALTWRVRAF
ncbi:aldose epimerase family protein [Herbiconiux daphne]|uniref:Galactose mutarotase n=1 Tax=Herbiconiux daphne TaxID=2970914 RepID=A0ABT2H3G2_9MICO|nr:galactose mutarotase [Herbiconiux daphne]MCS5734449.1 galactose mutarotase [Herbiconiux daphne]